MSLNRDPNIWQITTETRDFILKIFKFLFYLFGHEEKKSLIRKIRLISKLIMSQPG